MKKAASHRPISFKIPKSPQDGLRVQVDEGLSFYPRLHFHPEFQITAIVTGEGHFYAGNNMTDFAEGDVFFIGSNVPHLFKCTDSPTAAPGVKSVSLFFDDQSFGTRFFELKEMHRIKAFLAAARRVVKATAPAKKILSDWIVRSTELVEESLIINLLQILSHAQKASPIFMNNEQYAPVLAEKESSRMNEVLEYTFNHYHEEITIDKIAGIACLSRSQFSSFFKLHTGKTYIRFLNDLRIENACSRLKNGDDTVAQICYEVGFKNVSNFTRQFRQQKGVAPAVYRKGWKV